MVLKNYLKEKQGMENIKLCVCFQEKAAVPHTIFVPLLQHTAAPDFYQTDLLSILFKPEKLAHGFRELQENTEPLFISHSFLKTSLHGYNYLTSQGAEQPWNLFL